MYARHRVSAFLEEKMKIRKWEIVLAAVLVFVLGASMRVSAQQRALSDKLIRLHVVANSDSDTDQAMKLQVRDAVLDTLSGLLSGVTDRDAAEKIIAAHIPQIEQAASAAVRRAGGQYSVCARIAQENSPTKVYETFALPAGAYTSLRVIIGGGGGHNWWCVLYPPLCTASALDSSSAAALTDDEIALITNGGGEYAVRFRCMELLGKLRAWLER